MLLYIKENNVKVCQVLMIKDLNVYEIIKFARRVWEINKYLQELDKSISKEVALLGWWVLHLNYPFCTLAHEEFKMFINSRLKKREKVIALTKKP